MVVFLFIFRGPIERLIDRINLTKFSGWGVNIEFEEGLSKADKLAGAENFTWLPQPPTAVTAALEFSPEPRGDTKLGEPSPAFAVISPEGLILRAWARFSDQAKTLLQALPGRRPLESDLSDQWPERLATELGLGQGDIEAIRELRRLRNKIAHARIGPLGMDEAERFQFLTEGVMDKISRRWPGYSDGAQSQP